MSVVTSPKLSVVKIDDFEICCHERFRRGSSEVATFVQTAAEWGQISAKKCAEKVSEVEKTQFRQIGGLCGQVPFCALSCEHSMPFVLCKDRGARIQAIALFALNKAGELEIALMVTHPHNVRSQANAKEENRVRGAGSALVHGLRKHFLLPIALQTLTTSQSFYERLSFIPHPSNPKPLTLLLQAPVTLVSEKERPQVIKTINVWRSVSAAKSFHDSELACQSLLDESSHQRDLSDRMAICKDIETNRPVAVALLSVPGSGPITIRKVATLPCDLRMAANGADQFQNATNILVRSLMRKDRPMLVVDKHAHPLISRL